MSNLICNKGCKGCKDDLKNVKGTDNIGKEFIKDSFTRYVPSHKLPIDHEMEIPVIALKYEHLRLHITFTTDDFDKKDAKFNKNIISSSQPHQNSFQEV